MSTMSAQSITLTQTKYYGQHAIEAKESFHTSHIAPTELIMGVVPLFVPRLPSTGHGSEG